MRDIVLLPKNYRRFPFGILNAVIRTDGRYYDCTITFFNLSKKSSPKEASGIVGMQILSSNMQSLETMLQNIASIYPPKKNVNVDIIHDENVLKNRIGKLV